MKVTQKVLRGGRAEIVEITIDGLTLYFNGDAIVAFVSPGAQTFTVTEDVWGGRMNRVLSYYWETLESGNRTPRADFLSALAALGIDVSDQKA